MGAAMRVVSRTTALRAELGHLRAVLLILWRSYHRLCFGDPAAETSAHRLTLRDQP